MTSRPTRSIQTALSAGLLAFALVAPDCAAASLTVKVSTPELRPVANVVVTLAGIDSLATTPEATPVAVMLQQQREFRPYILPVRTGTTVRFPNYDEVRHHVYSFSRAKRFELKLYPKGETPSILMQAPGVVALGCNIHDAMRGYIYVTDAPHFDLTSSDGTLRFDNLDPGSYQLTIWYPGMQQDRRENRKIIITTGTDTSINLAIPLDPNPLPPPGPAPDDWSDY